MHLSRLQKNKNLPVLTGVIVAIALFTALSGCNSHLGNAESVEELTDVKRQDAIFKHLLQLTNGTISEQKRKDSLAFLILPVQASCPSCRNKTIDSIIKYSGSLSNGHFIIISANGGRKSINGYFEENGSKLPAIQNRLFLDTVNMAREYELYDKKPTMYYTFNEKAYKKVSAIPATVKEDLREFFSGYRKNEN